MTRPDGSARRAVGRRAAGIAALATFVFALGATTPIESPVADAAESGDIEAVRTLLRSGADANTAQPDGMTALHWAAARNDLEIARTLLYAGATHRATTRLGGYTPLHLASRAGNTEAAALLLEAGADPNALTTTGVTAMHFAADSDAFGVVEALAAHGADVNARDSFAQRTPLMFAAVRGADASVRALLEAGADPSLVTRVKDYETVDRELRAEQRQRARVRAAAEEPEESEQQAEAPGARPQAAPQQQTPPGGTAGRATGKGTDVGPADRQAGWFRRPALRRPRGSSLDGLAAG